MSPPQVVCALLVPLFWGLQFVVIKVGLTAFPPLFFVGLRFAAVAAILLPFVGRPTRRELGPMIAISVFFGGLNFALFFVGLGQGLASVSAVANQLSTPFTVLLAWPFLGERPSTRVIIGVALAFGGVALTVAEPSASVKIVPMRLSPAGDGAFVSAGIEESLTFASGDGPASAVTMHRPDSRTEHGNRIDSATAAVIEERFQHRLAGAPSRFVSQRPMPGSREALQQVIADLRRGAPDYGRMSPELADKVRRTLAPWREALSLSGAPQSLAFRGVGPGGYDVFIATFATGSAEFRIDLSPEGTIDDLTYRPDGDASPGGLADCTEEPGLAAAADRAPIWLSLVNHSGADLSLFRLDGSGRRLRTGSIESGASAIVLTDVARPLVIASSTGRCREILWPGQTTRVHVVLPGSTDAQVAPGPETRAAVSENALRHYIEGVSRGVPDYDRMAPQAAAVIRQILPRQQAILARLGPARGISFRGVTSMGDSLFRVQFANGTAEWRIAVTEDGKIDAIALLP